MLYYFVLVLDMCRLRSYCCKHSFGYVWLAPAVKPQGGFIQENISRSNTLQLVTPPKRNKLPQLLNGWKWGQNPMGFPVQGVPGKPGVSLLLSSLHLFLSPWQFSVSFFLRYQVGQIELWWGKHTLIVHNLDIAAVMKINLNARHWHAQRGES